MFTVYGSLQNHLSTELNALADNANILGAEIDFSASGVDRQEYIDVEVFLNTVDLSLATTPEIHLWMLKQLDGTNYEDGGVGVDPGRAPDATITLRKVNATQRLIVTLPTTPGVGKILFGNRAEAALAATLNTVKYRVYDKSR